MPQNNSTAPGTGDNQDMLKPLGEIQPSEAQKILAEQLPELQPPEVEEAISQLLTMLAENNKALSWATNDESRVYYRRRIAALQLAIGVLCP